MVRNSLFNLAKRQNILYNSLTTMAGNHERTFIMIKPDAVHR